MKLAFAIALGVLALAITLVAARGVPSTVTYIPHDTVNATMAKGGEIIGENGLIVLAQRRGAGEVEVHEKGDVITIPAKTPHWFKEVPSKTIAYYAVNLEP